jgi:PAS domain S-box-containing protein
MLNTVSVPDQFRPLFEKAQEYVDRYFGLKMEDPSRGTIEVFGERYILVRAASMSVDFFDTIRNLYSSEGNEKAINIARSILFDIAHTIGKMDARNFHKKMSLKDPIEKLSAGPVHFSHTGWAFVNIFPESNPSADENYYLLYDHPFSFESDAWVRAGRQTEFPVCVMNAGYSSGWCEESFGLSLVASEIMCKAKGDEACRFVMAHPSKIEQYIQDYLNKTPEIAKKVTTCRIPGLFERKWMEEKLHESETNYQTIFNEANDAILVHDPDSGNILDVNKKMCEMFGYTRDEALMLDVGAISSCQSPYTQQDALEWIKKTSEEESQIFEWQAKHKDGHMFWIEVNLKRSKIMGGDRVLAVVRDVTERKHLHDVLDRKQRSLEAIFDAVPVGMILVDDQGFVRRVNDVVAKLVHRDFSEIINKQPGEGLMCIHALDHLDGCGFGPFCSTCPVRKTFENVLCSWQSARGIEVQAALLVDGKEVNPWLDITAEPAFVDGSKHVVLAIQDITERKNAEKELEQVNHQLKTAIERANWLAKEATKANSAKSQFLAKMSHEIRTPMNAIIGFADLLAEEPLTDGQKEHLEIIRDASRNLLRLIDDILYLSKIEAGKLGVEVAECLLGQLLNSVESLMQPKAKEKGLDFEIIEVSKLPVNIRTDMARVRQCLINLTGNAIKFTEQGHVYIKVSLEDKDDQPYIRFDVEDTGIGIPVEKQEEIFESFTQADESTTRKYGGTGLGLAITKQLAELLGGRITVTSEVEKGSVFSLTIPAGTNVKEQPFLDRHNVVGNTGAEESKAEQARFSGQILVAEDAKTNQLLIESLLTRFGLQITIVEDGGEALRKALTERFDLIFMDIEMPKMNGYETTRAIRKEGLKVPIVALTAYAMKGDDEKCFEAGCDDYMCKPIERQRLVQILHKYLPAKNDSIIRKIDSVESDVEQINWICSESSFLDTRKDGLPEELSGEPPVDSALINTIYDDTHVFEETVKIFLEEAPIGINMLAEAIDAMDSANVRQHAHKLKGSAKHVAAIRLHDKLNRLEHMGRERELKGAGELFAEVKAEFEEVKSFLSRPNIYKKAYGIWPGIR